jgi:hypothetical protein
MRDLIFFGAGVLMGFCLFGAWAAIRRSRRAEEVVHEGDRYYGD